MNTQPTFLALALAAVTLTAINGAALLLLAWATRSWLGWPDTLPTYWEAALAWAAFHWLLSAVLFVTRGGSST